MVEQYKPQDTTTNPSLILGAMNKAEYASLIAEAVAYAKAASGVDSEAARLQLAADKVFVNFGLELLKRIPGRVSTEVDARLSFDTAATVARAQKIIALYEAAGVDWRQRVLIKIASTWEGLQAAKQLQEQGIQCNMTLIFALAQARVAGEVKAKLISPFVGRITDYWKAKRGVAGFAAEEDPGVLSVKEIYHEMTAFFGHQVEVMGASFRNTDQILALTGLPLLTISPDLLQQLEAITDRPLARLLNDPVPDPLPDRPHLSQAQFLFQLNADECASFKLADRKSVV